MIIRLVDPCGDSVQTASHTLPDFTRSRGHPTAEAPPR